MIIRDAFMRKVGFVHLENLALTKQKQIDIYKYVFEKIITNFMETDQ